MATMGKWLTVADIVALTGWTSAYVSKRACLDQWEKLGTRPQQYNSADVTRSVSTTRDTRIRKRLLHKYA